jgi:hypothetical protein
MLALGALFLSFSTEYAEVTYSLLFGEVFGVGQDVLLPGHGLDRRRRLLPNQLAARLLRRRHRRRLLPGRPGLDRRPPALAGAGGAASVAPRSRPLGQKDQDGFDGPSPRRLRSPLRLGG